MAKDMPRTFNTVVLPHARDHENPYPRQMMKHILNDFAGVDHGRLLDLGGGWGTYTLLAKELGFDAFSIDRENAAANVPSVVCDVANDTFPIEANSVDVVFSKSVIEHFYLSQLPHLMGEVFRVLKPGGAFIVMTPDWDSNVKNFYKVFSHVTPYTCESLAQCLTMFGFDKVKVDKLVQLPIAWDSSVFALLSRVTAMLPLPRSTSKWVRWSKELSLIGVGYKPDF